MSELVPTFIIEAILSDDKRAVSLRATARFVAESLCKPISSESIHQLLAQKGLGQFLVHQEQLDEIVEALTEAIEQIQTEADTKGLSVETDPIAEAVDAVAEAEISEDKLLAVLSVTSAQGGEHISLDNAEQLLEDIGVTYGIDAAKIEALLEKARLQTDGKTCSDTVAQALLPIRGDDADFIPLVDTANERILKPKLLKDGTVDMLDLGDMPTVKEGAELLRKVPPTPGEKGINVCWGMLAPEQGTDFDFKPGKCTKISEDDELILISTISGQPNLLKRGMKVDDAVKVSAVDLSTGHVTLDANLIVKGDISEGMKVRCEGDITVGGVIESADVIAKGNIIIGKGILGRTHEHSHSAEDFTVSIKTEGSIYGMFASYAKLEAGKDIIIAEQLLHCDVTSGEQVIVGNDRTVGSQIVGGITRASSGIETDILGASAGVYTQLDLSGPYNVKSYELSCNRSIIDAKTTMLSNMRDAYSRLMSLRLTEARKIHIKKVKNTMLFLDNEINELNIQGDQINEESEKLCEHLIVSAKRKIQPGVSLIIGRAKFKSTRARESGELFYQDNEINYNPAIIQDKK